MPLPVRPESSASPTPFSDAARLRERAAELRDLATLIHGSRSQERMRAMADELEASAARLEGLVRDMGNQA